MHPILNPKVSFEEFIFLFENLLSYCPFVPTVVCEGWLVELFPFAIFVIVPFRSILPTAWFSNFIDSIRSAFQLLSKFTVASKLIFFSVHYFLDLNYSNLFTKVHSFLSKIKLSYGIIEFVFLSSDDFDPILHNDHQIIECSALNLHFLFVKVQDSAHMMNFFVLFKFVLFEWKFVVMQSVF